MPETLTRACTSSDYDLGIASAILFGAKRNQLSSCLKKNILKCKARDLRKSVSTASKLQADAPEAAEHLHDLIVPKLAALSISVLNLRPFER